MQIKLTRETLLPALQAVANVVERRQTLPILSNVLLNADGSPTGQGAKLSLPNTALGADGLLHVNESVTVRFSVGLTTAELSVLTLNANGMPHDWAYDAPPLDGPAQNASFVFTVRADNPLYLPLVRK